MTGARREGGAWTRAARALAAAACLAPGAAAADHATEAKLRFDRGVEHIQSGDVRAALDEFFISDRLSPNPTATYNIASCLEALGRTAEAFSEFSAYLEWAALTEEEVRAGRAALARILPRVARISVASDPPGAAIYFDRTNLGQHGVTPRTLAHEPGPHALILSLPGYHPAQQAVELRLGEEVRLHLRLEPLVSAVHVETTPPGAEVRRDGPDGEVLGRTPLDTELQIGDRWVYVSKEGHEGRRELVTVRVGAAARVRTVLQALPAPKGRLRVMASVPNALVRVAGREAGYTPLVVELPRGDHDVRVERKGYTPWSGRVSIDADRPLAAEVTLRPVHPEDPLRTWKWVIGATSATAAVLAVAAGLQARAVADDFERSPTRSRFDDVRRLNLAADSLYGLAVLGGAALAALILGPDAPSTESTVDLASPEALGGDAP